MRNYIIALISLLFVVSSADAQYGNRWRRYNPEPGRGGYRMQPKRHVSVAMIDSTGRAKSRRHYVEIDRWRECAFRIDMPVNPDSGFRRSNDSTRIILGYPQTRMEYYLRRDDCFEWEIILDRKPESNRFEYNIESENLNFFFQDSAAIADDPTIDCPDSVYNSYAVYHATKRNNKYETGKAFHIYRPRIHSGRDTAWCDISIGHGRFIITAPQDFLDHCGYPATIDPTLGYTSQGAAGGWAGEYLRAYKAGVIDVGDDGNKIDSCCVHIYYINAGPHNFRGILFDHDDVNDEPNDSISCFNADYSISATGWDTITTEWSSCWLIGDSTYWLGWLTDCATGSNLQIAIDYSGGDDAKNNTYTYTNFPTMPANFGAPTQETACPHSFYVWHSASESNDPPAIEDIVQNPPSPDPGEPCEISATITDDGAIDYAQLYYKIASEYDTLYMANTVDSFYATIPGQDGVTVYYYLVAMDDEGDSTVSDTSSYAVDHEEITGVQKATHANSFNHDKIKWQYSYGNDSLYEQARDVIKTSDGGYVLSGYGYSNAARGKDVYVVKTDSLGNMEWENRYGGSDDECGHCVIENHDNQLVLGGYTKSAGAGNKDIYVLVLNMDGDSLAAYTYGGIASDFSMKLIETSDSHYVLAGQSSSGALDSDPYIIKLDSDFDSVWSAFWVVSNGALFQGMAEMGDGNYFLSGLSYSTQLGDDSVNGSRPDGFVMKVNSATGDSIWTNNNGGDYWYENYQSTVMNDGNLLTVGGGWYIPNWTADSIYTPSMNPTLLITDSSDGSHKYYQEYYFPGNSVYSHHAEQLASGNIALDCTYGMKNYGYRNKCDAAVIVTDRFGNMIYWDRFGGVHGDQFFDFTVDRGDLIAACGVYGKDSTNYTYNSGDFWLVKYDCSPPTIPGGKKPILVLFDSLMAGTGQSLFSDSTFVLFNMLAWGGYVYDSLCLGDYADELFGDTVGAVYTEKKAKFLDYIDDYAVVMVLERRIGAYGDTSSSTPARGLAQYQIACIPEYIYQGGVFIGFDNWLTQWNYDSLGYAKIFGWAASGTHTTDSINVYPDNGFYRSYLGQSHHITHIDGVNRDGKEITTVPIITELGGWVDTLAASGEGINRPLIIAAEYGLGGMAIQWIATIDFYHHVYDGGNNLTRFGAGCGLDYLLFAQLDYGLAKHGVSATFEMQGLYSFLVDDVIGDDSLGNDGYRQTLGRFLTYGFPTTNSYYISRMNSTDSLALADLNKSAILSNTYQSYDEDLSLFIDTSDSTGWTTAEWDSIAAMIADHENTYMTGNVVSKDFKADAWLWATGENYCMVDSFLSWGITFTHNRRGPYPDIPSTVKYGRPHQTRLCAADWVSFQGDIFNYWRDRLWQYGYWKPNGYWEPGAYYDPWAAAYQNITDDDTVAAIKEYLGQYIEGAWRAKFGGTVYHHSPYSEVYGYATNLDSILPWLADTLDQLGAVFVTNMYLEQLSCYRDSVYVMDYRSDKNRVTFTLKHIYNQGVMPIDLYYTARKVMADNSIAMERVFVPKGWRNQIMCRSEWDPKKKQWAHFPGYKARTGKVKAIDEGKNGWIPE